MLLLRPNSYDILNFLHQDKFEIQKITIKKGPKTSSKLSEVQRILDGITLKKYAVDYRIDVRNTYSKVTATLDGHEGYVFNLISLDQNTMASCSEDKKIIIWNLNTGEKKFEINKAHMHCIYSLCKLPKRYEQFVSGGFGEMKIWSTQDYHLVKTVKGHNDYITNIKILKYDASSPYQPNESIIDPNQSSLLNRSGSASSELKINNNRIGTLLNMSAPFKIIGSCSFDKTVNLWFIDTWENFITLKGHNGNVNSIVQYNQYNNEVITCSHDKTIKFWDMSDGKEIGNLEAHESPVHSLLMLSNGNLVSGSFNDIKIWDLDKKITLMTFNQRNMGVFFMLELDDGRLISASFKEINVWDIKENRWIFSLEGHESFITSLLLLEDGRLVSASDDKTIKIWE